MKNLAIIIPVYNEEKNISKLLSDWLRIVPKYHKKNYKFIIINDGSIDKTHNKIKKIKSKYIYYIRQKNIGHGSTCIKGYKLAIKKNFDTILQIDSDDQCDPKYFKLFLKEIKRYDVVFGYRIHREDGYFRKIFSHILSLLIFLKTFVYIKDSNVPYRMIKIDVLKKTINNIPKKVILKNVYLSYLIVKSHSIKWVNINFKKRKFGKSKYNLLNMISMTINLIINIKGK